MKKLDGLLERFYKSLLSSERLKEEVKSVVLECTGALLDKEKIFYKEGVIEIQAPSAIKNEINLKENKILNLLNQKGVRIKKITYR